MGRFLDVEVEHLACLSHQGKVVVVMLTPDSQGGAELLYTVRRDGFEPESASQVTANAAPEDWEPPRPLPLSAQAQDTSVVEREAAQYAASDGQVSFQLLTSVYGRAVPTSGTRAHEAVPTLVAPIGLLSAFDRLYLFRCGDQAVLAERFVLDGLTNRLLPTMEVRHRRSRQRHRAAAVPQASGADVVFDSLSTHDLRGVPFFEPAVALGFLGPGVGGVAVTTVPTASGGSRWHFATIDPSADTELVLTSVAATDDGWFDLEDGAAPAIVTEVLTLSSPAVAPPSTSVYGVQRHNGSSGESVLLKAEARLMTVVPTRAGLATVDLGLAADGTAARVSETDRIRTRLRGVVTDLRLSAASVRSAEPVLAAAPRRGGTVTSARRDERDLVEVGIQGTPVPAGGTIELAQMTRVDGAHVVVPLDVGVLSGPPGRRKDGLGTLPLTGPGSLEPVEVGDRLRVVDPQGRKSVVRVARATPVGARKLIVDRPPEVAQSGARVVLNDEVQSLHGPTALGDWEESLDQIQLTRPGEVTGYRVVADALRLRVPDHGIDRQAEVEVEASSGSLDGRHRVVAAEGDRVVVEAPWPGPRMAAQEESPAPAGGLTMMTGEASFVADVAVPTGPGTVELWLRTTVTSGPLLSVVPSDASSVEPTSWELLIDEGRVLARNAGGDRIVTRTWVADASWHHLAISLGPSETRLVVDGVVQASSTAPAWANRAGGSIHLGGRAGGGWVGEVAEVRVWSVARTDDAIALDRSRVLAGHERGLIGCWPCQDLVGDPPQAADVINGPGATPHPGRVNGPVFAGLARLETELAGGAQVVGYRNDALLAITGGQNYLESFEFLVVGGSSDVPAIPFDVELRGKSSRSSDAWITVEPTTTPTWRDLEDGWRSVSHEFVVGSQSQVSLIRTFAIADLRVPADDPARPATLLVRNHRIVRSTESTTRDRGSGVLLTDDHDAADSYTDAVRELAPLELELVAHDGVVDRLQAALTGLPAPADLAARRASLAEDLSAARREATSAREAHLSELNDPLNRQGPFLIASGADPTRRLALIDDGIGVSLEVLDASDPALRNNPAQVHWVVEQSDAEPGTAQRVTLSCTPETITYRLATRRQPGSTPRVELWKVGDSTDQTNHLWSVPASRDPRWLDATGNGEFHLHPTSFPDIQATGHHAAAAAATTAQWRFLPVRWAAASTIGQRRIDQARQRSKSADGRVAQLQFDVATLDRGEALSRELRHAVASRTATAQRISAFDALLPPAQRTWPWDPDPVRDRRGLLTRGAMLPVRPVGAVELRTLPEGDVEVLGCDDQGRLARYRYDAVADSTSTTFEQWSAPAGRQCLALEPTGILSVRRDQIVLERHARGWTIELWYFHAPIAPGVIGAGSVVRTTLVACSNTEHLELQQSEGGLFLGTNFQTGFVHCGVDLQELAVGWHHLAVRAAGVGDEARTEMFVDGRLLGALQTDGLPPGAPRRLDDPIRFFGNDLLRHRTRPVRLAEIRVWQVALRDDEVAANAVADLAGLAPDLIAWYRLGDSTTTAPNNAAAGTHDATIEGGQRVPFTGRVGHPGSAVLPLRGQEIEVPRRLIPPVGAVEFWVRFGPWERQPTLEMVWSRGATPDEDHYPVVPLPADGDWHHVAIRWGHYDTSAVFVDAVLVPRLSGVVPVPAPTAATLRGWSDEAAQRRDAEVVVAEARLWRTGTGLDALEEILRRRHRRPPVGDPDLLWQADPAAPWNWDRPPVSTLDNRLPVACSSPVSCDQVIYGEAEPCLQRAVFLVGSKGVHLLTGLRVARLELDWVGTAQTTPTLMGYIEGAPPVPSENLTVDPHEYLGASSVQVTTQDEVIRSWSRSEVTDVGVELSAYFGPKMDADAAVVKATSEFLAGGSLSGSYSSGWETTFSAQESTTVVDRLDLVGSVEDEAHFARLGRRFVPKNVGYAVVASGLADVFVTRLAGSRRMVSYLVRPALGVPPSLNTITFMMNPAYVMNGSLDGATGSATTSERHTPGLRELRRRFGWRYPASYFRVAEAMALKERIALEEGRRRAHFANLELDVVRLIDSSALPAPEAAESSGDPTKDIENALTAATSAVDSITSAVLPDKHAKNAHDAWSRRLETMRATAAPRNIVNSYVWDADGGLRTESQQFAASIEQHFGAAGSLQLGLGVTSQGALTAIVGAGFELSFLETVQVTATVSKAETTSRGFSLDVDLSGVERLGVTDFKDRPLQPGEKVDRYTFSSFYLEGARENFQHFFAELVDRQWLAGNDEEARALRQVSTGRPSRPWRVLHRVTGVERPILTGFDRE